MDFSRCLHKEDDMKYKIPFFHCTSAEILYTTISEAITTRVSTSNVIKPNLMRAQLVLKDRLKAFRLCGEHTDPYSGIESPAAKEASS